MGAHMTVHASECPIQVEYNFLSPKQKEYILRLTFQEASPSPSSSSSVALDPRNMMPLDPKQVNQFIAYNPSVFINCVFFQTPAPNQPFPLPIERQKSSIPKVKLCTLSVCWTFPFAGWHRGDLGVSKSTDVLQCTPAERWNTDWLWRSFKFFSLRLGVWGGLLGPRGHGAHHQDPQRQQRVRLAGGVLHHPHFSWPVCHICSCKCVLSIQLMRHAFVKYRWNSVNWMPGVGAFVLVSRSILSFPPGLS